MLNFDNASTSQISEKSLQAYINASKYYYNPSSLYEPSVKSKEIVNSARAFFMQYFSAPKNSTIIFTACATESNNSVLSSMITRKDKTYLIGGGEHSSIYVCANKYLAQGYDIQFIKLTDNGGIDIKDLKSKLTDKLAGVSIIHVSNETGAINDIKKITEIIKDFNPNILVHSDGVQAVGKLNINLKELGVDYYTMTAHKINGPKGIGALYIANPNKFKPFLVGGEQEMNLRAGTENVPAISAYKTALQELKIVDYSKHKQAFLENLFGDYVLVSNAQCVDNIISICFKGVRGETIQHMLEAKGYLIGTGSSCNSKAKINRVVSQIVPKDYAEGAVRISFDNCVGIDDCKQLAIELSNAVKEYRKRIKRWIK